MGITFNVGTQLQFLMINSNNYNLLLFIINKTDRNLLKYDRLVCEL